MPLEELLQAYFSCGEVPDVGGAVNNSDISSR